MALEQAGPVVLFGSGETTASGQKIYEWLLRQLEPPIHIAVLETPAGFQPNTAVVAGKVADFMREHLPNYRPQVSVVPARRRGTPFSPDNPNVVAPLLSANVIFLGPGSPTYAVRQLRDSLAWHTLVARHRLGAAVVLASAATVAASAHALPVYEIYKAGDDLHWQSGLDFFGACNLPLVFVPHWNNAEGGAELDTSRCFMGQERFAQLLAMLPAPAAVVGIDEHTALVMDLAGETFQVMGKGEITLLRQGEEQHFGQGRAFALAELGACAMPEAPAGLPPEVWARVRAAREEGAAPPRPEVPAEVRALVEERQAARARRDWAAADTLRRQIAALGWQVLDTPEGPRLEPAARMQP